MIKKEIRKITKYSLFLLVLLPTLTEYLEVGHFPTTLRDLLTESVLTIVVAAIIALFYRQRIKIESLSLKDALTGISNRRRFDIDIKKEVLRANRTCRGLCLIFFDLDNFKEINDRFGHQEGDKTLVMSAQALSSFIRSGTDSCYRFGGDEFAVLLTNIKDDKFTEIEDRLVSVLDGQEHNRISASKGIVFLRRGETHNKLVERADEAMYLDKKRRKGVKSPFDLRCLF